MTAVTVDQLRGWLDGFCVSAAASGDDDLARGLLAALADTRAASTVDELFRWASLALVGAAGEHSGPVYGTFLLRFGMTAANTGALDAAALGSALRAGLEGLRARGADTTAEPSIVAVLAPAIDAFDAAVAGGASAADAASIASAVAFEANNRDAETASAALMLSSLAAAIAA